MYRNVRINIITVHLVNGNEYKKWYEKKKPLLQLEILGCLVLKGPLTKGQVEKILKKRHGDILDSINNLAKKKFN